MCSAVGLVSVETTLAYVRRCCCVIGGKGLVGSGFWGGCCGEVMLFGVLPSLRIMAHEDVMIVLAPFIVGRM
jgi:hypothetical protein